MNLKLSIFSNAGTVPLEIAIRQGFFENSGLIVDIEPTTSSVKQMTGVIDGRFDIAATAIDNVIAYNCGQGAAPTINKSNLKVFLGSASYRLPFVVAPGIDSFDQLRARTIAVDALDTGFAFLLREILEINGLSTGSYTFKSFGAPKERWQALHRGEADGALLNAHFQSIAHKASCNTLNSAPDPWDNYEGNTFCAGREFLENGPVEEFIDAVLQAVKFTKDAQNTTEVATALVQHLGNLDYETAIDVAQSLHGDESILANELPVSRGGTQEVLRLREKYTATRLGLTPEQLCDPRVTFTL